MVIVTTANLTLCCIFIMHASEVSSYTCPYTRLSLLVVVFMSHCPTEEVVGSLYKTKINLKNIQGLQYLSPIYLPSPRPIPSPKMESWVGVLLTEYMQNLTVLLIPVDSVLLFESIPVISTQLFIGLVL